MHIFKTYCCRVYFGNSHLEEEKSREETLNVTKLDFVHFCQPTTERKFTGYSSLCNLTNHYCNSFIHTETPRLHHLATNFSRRPILLLSIFLTAAEDGTGRLLSLLQRTYPLQISVSQNLFFSWVVKTFFVPFFSSEALPWTRSG